MKKLKFYGLGGQGVVTAAKIFATSVALYEDKYATTVPAYGHERRGAPVFTDIIISDKPVLTNSFVYEPDIVLVMDDTIIDKDVDISSGIHEETILILNSDNLELIDRYGKEFNFRKIYYVDGTQIAFEYIGKGIPNSSMLGALSSVPKIVTIESIGKSIMDFFGGKAGELNVKAARKAYKETKEL